MLLQKIEEHFQVVGTYLLLTLVEESVKVISVKNVHHVCLFFLANHLRPQTLEHLGDALVSFLFIHVIVDNSSYFLDDIIVFFLFVCL